MALPSILGTQTVIRTCKQVAVCLHRVNNVQVWGAVCSGQGAEHTLVTREAIFVPGSHWEPCSKVTCLHSRTWKGDSSPQLASQAWGRRGARSNLPPPSPPSRPPPPSLPGGLYLPLPGAVSPAPSAQAFPEGTGKARRVHRRALEDRGTLAMSSFCWVFAVNARWHYSLKVEPRHCLPV